MEADVKVRPSWRPSANVEFVFMHFRQAIEHLFILRRKEPLKEAAINTLIEQVEQNIQTLKEL